MGAPCPVLTIDDEFRDLCPPLREQERRALEQSILKEGCLEPLFVWGTTIIDGHHRYGICQKHGIPFLTEELQFKTRREAKWWIIKHQLSRRNLSLIQASYLRGRFWSMAKTNDRRGVALRRGEKILQDGSRTQQEAVGKLLGVSASAIRNDYDLFVAIEALVPVARNYVLSGAEMMRKQHIIDLSALGRDTQATVVQTIQTAPTKTLASVMIALRGKGDRTRSSVTMKCPTCGVRLAKGVTTCLRCDLGDRRVAEAIAKDDGELPEGFEQRLQQVRESKQAEEGATLGDAVEFHAGRILRLLNETDKPRLHVDAVRVVRKMVKRLTQIIDFSAPRAKLHGESSYQLEKTRRAHK